MCLLLADHVHLDGWDRRERERALALWRRIEKRRGYVVVRNKEGRYRAAPGRTNADKQRQRQWANW